LRSSRLLAQAASLKDRLPAPPARVVHPLRVLPRSLRLGQRATPWLAIRFRLLLLAVPPRRTLDAHHRRAVHSTDQIAQGRQAMVVGVDGVLTGQHARFLWRWVAMQARFRDQVGTGPRHLQPARANSGIDRLHADQEVLTVALPRRQAGSPELLD